MNDYGVQVKKCSVLSPCQYIFEAVQRTMNGFCLFFKDLRENATTKIQM